MDTSGNLSALLVINKPSGLHSGMLTRRIGRRIGIKTGHAGTLDPAADGVLPLLLGRATRLSRFFLTANKVYTAMICLGVETDTLDADGTVVARHPLTAKCTRDYCAATLDRFTGEIEQVPPVYSAIRVNGKRLYRYARAGEEVARSSRSVHVHKIDLLRFDPPLLSVRVTSGSGFYVRSFAADLGTALGCGAHLAHLTRDAVGTLGLKQAVSPRQVEEAVARKRLAPLLTSVAEGMCFLPAITLDQTLPPVFQRGWKFPVRTSVAKRAQDCRLLLPGGRFIGIAGPLIDTVSGDGYSSDGRTRWYQLLWIP